MCGLMLGCKQSYESKIDKEIDSGKIIDANLVETSFNESIKSVIKTDKGVFIIYGMPSVMIGENSSIRLYDNGKRYLCADSWTYCKLLSN